MFFSNITLITLLILILAGCSKLDRPPDPVTDVDGNTYKTVRIGNQIFMAENLRTTRFNDGTEIPEIVSSEAWRILSSPGYCWYGNEKSENNTVYGALYNGYAADSAKLCPVGWHVPTKEDLDELRLFSGDTISCGGKFKETGTAHWSSPNIGADNSLRFNAVGAGIRYFEGSFNAQTNYTAFWSSNNNSSDSKSYMSLYSGDEILKTGSVSKKYGLSVRCVKD